MTSFNFLFELSKLQSFNKDSILDVVDRKYNEANRTRLVGVLPNIIFTFIRQTMSYHNIELDDDFDFIYVQTLIGNYINFTVDIFLVQSEGLGAIYELSTLDEQNRIVFKDRSEKPLNPFVVFLKKLGSSQHIKFVILNLLNIMVSTPLYHEITKFFKEKGIKNKWLIILIKMTVLLLTSSMFYKYYKINWVFEPDPNNILQLLVYSMITMVILFFISYSPTKDNDLVFLTQDGKNILIISIILLAIIHQGLNDFEIYKHGNEYIGGLLFVIVPLLIYYIMNYHKKKFKKN